MEVSGQRHAPAALYPPGKGPPVPIVQEAGWAPEPVWAQRLEEKSSTPAGDRTSDHLVVHSVARHWTDRLHKVKWQIEFPKYLVEIQIL
jgi:hypothetical protein